MDKMKKSDRWLAEHRRTIGGGLSAAACGTHEFISPVEAYYYMTDGQSKDIGAKPDVLRGSLLEPVALKRLGDVLDVEVEAHDQNSFGYNVAYPWAHVLEDGWIYYNGERIPVEIKVPNPRNWDRLDLGVAEYIRCQCIHNCAMLRTRAILLVCLNPVSMEIWSCLFEPTAAEIDVLMTGEESFMRDHVAVRIPPLPRDDSDLKLLFPAHTTGKTITSDSVIDGAHSELMRLMPEYKRLENRISAYKYDLKSYMETAETLVNRSGEILATWRSHEAQSLNAQALKKQRPDMWKEFAENRTQRMFLAKTVIAGG